MVSTATTDRFWSKVDKTGDCWEWRAGRYRSGYGTFNHDGRMQRAHRVSYELCVGPIPEGSVVMHLCDNPSCVNPDHLRLGAQADNMRDMTLKGRRAVGAAHGRAHLSDADVASIRREYIRTYERTPAGQWRSNSRELADTYRCGERHIRRIVTGQSRAEGERHAW